jgi:hypothetical protein
MKRFLIFCLISGLLCGQMVIWGCAGNPLVTTPSTKPDALKNPFVVASYKQLYLMAQAYNVAWQTFYDLHSRGVVNDADFTMGQQIARQYRQANNDAVDALVLVEKGTYSQDQAQVILSLVLTANKMILDYLGPRVAKKGGQ